MSARFCWSRFLLFVLLFGKSSFLFSQITKQSIEKGIAKEIENARRGAVLQSGNSELLLANPQFALKNLKKFDSEQSSNVRFSVQTMRYKIARNTDDPSVRKEVIETLVQDCFSSDHVINQQAAKRLLSFRAVDFSNRARSRIASFEPGANTDQILLITGVAQVRKQIPFLQRLSARLTTREEGWYGSAPWLATLALARMNNPKAITDVITKTQQEPDMILRVTKLLADVAYTRQSEGIELIRKYLESEDRLPGVKTSDPGIKYNQYAMSFLAQTIKDFPIKDKGIGYSDEEVALARSWMASRTNYELIK